jgi:uncharacterized protein YukE
MMFDNPLKDDGMQIVQAAGPTPMQLCSGAALAEERQTNQQIVRGAQQQAAIQGQTILGEKLEAYSAEFEIAHRAMTRSCQLLANCMDQNRGNEMQCTKSSERMTATEDRYYDLLSQRDQLVAQVEIAKAQAAPKARSQPKGCKKDPCKPAKSRCQETCATTANIFTDDCCPAN